MPTKRLHAVLCNIDQCICADFQIQLTVSAIILQPGQLKDKVIKKKRGYMSVLYLFIGPNV